MSETRNTLVATTVIQGEALSENGRISGGELNKPPVVKRPARNISSSKASGPFATRSHIGGELSQGGTIAGGKWSAISSKLVKGVETVKGIGAIEVGKPFVIKRPARNINSSKASVPLATSNQLVS